MVWAGSANLEDGVVVDLGEMESVLLMLFCEFSWKELGSNVDSEDGG